MPYASCWGPDWYKGRSRWKVCFSWCLQKKKGGGINKGKRRKVRRKNGRKEEELKEKEKERGRKEGRKSKGKRKRPSILSFIYLFIHSYSLISHCSGNRELPYTLLLNSFFAQVIKNWYLLLITRAAWLMQLWNPQVWERLLGVALTPAVREQAHSLLSLPLSYAHPQNLPLHTTLCPHPTRLLAQVFEFGLHTTLQKSLDTCVPSLHCQQPEYTNQCFVHPCISRAW